jgi:hypothetical protein
MPTIKTMRFQLGQTVATPGALDALQRSNETPWAFLVRHLAGDWGDVCLEDREANDEAVRDGSRILSAYTLKTGEKIWVITEADRSVTTILLPDEY